MGKSLAVQKPGSLLFVTVFVHCDDHFFIFSIRNYTSHTYIMYHVEELSERVFFFHDVTLHAHKTCRAGQKREKNITINTWKRCEHKIIYAETRQNRNKDTFQKQLYLNFLLLANFRLVNYYGRTFNSVLQLWP